MWVKQSLFLLDQLTFARLEITSMEYDSAKDAVEKRYFRAKKIVNTWVMCKNMNKCKKSIASSSPLYQTYTPIVI